VWKPIGVKVNHVSTMYAAYVRPDTQHTSLLTTVVWDVREIASMPHQRMSAKNRPF